MRTFLGRVRNDTWLQRKRPDLVGRLHPVRSGLNRCQTGCIWRGRDIRIDSFGGYGCFRSRHDEVGGQELFCLLLTWGEENRTRMLSDGEMARACCERE
jgi:hypothetical protein